MGSSSLHRRRWFQVTVAAALASVTAAGITFAAIPTTTTGRITACYATSGTRAGLIRIIDAQAGQTCATSERSINWQTNGVRYRGAYSTTGTYFTGDVVTSVGASYISLTTNKNVAPTTAGKWAAFAAKGATGATGPSGPQGPAGSAGRQYGRLIYEDVGGGETAAVNSRVSMALSVRGMPIVAYQSDAGGINVSTCLDALCDTFSTKLSLSTVLSEVMSEPSIAIASDGRPVISYTNGNGVTPELRLASCSTVACNALQSPVALGKQAAGSLGDFVVSPTQGASAVFDDPTIAGLQFVTCADARCSTYNPSTDRHAVGPVTGTNPTATLAYPLSTGRAVIAYQHSEVQGTLDTHVAICNDAACTNPVDRTLLTGTSAQVLRVAIGPRSNPIVSTYDTASGTVKLFVCADAACSSVTTQSWTTGASGAPRRIALTVQADGNPLIAFAVTGANDIVSCSVPDCSTSETVVESSSTKVAGAVTTTGGAVIARLNFGISSETLLYLGVAHTSFVPSGG